MAGRYRHPSNFATYPNRLHESPVSSTHGDRVDHRTHVTPQMNRAPAVFLFRHVSRQLSSHVVVLLSILAAVGCAVGAQYAVKNLVDVLDVGEPSDRELCGAVGLLLGL